MKKTKRMVYKFRYGNGPRRGQWDEYFLAVVPRRNGLGKELFDAIWARFWEKDQKTVKLRESVKIVQRLQEKKNADALAEALTA